MTLLLAAVPLVANALDVDGNGIDDAVEVQLAEKFKPSFILHVGRIVEPEPVEIMHYQPAAPLDPHDLSLEAWDPFWIEDPGLIFSGPYCDRATFQCQENRLDLVESGQVPDGQHQGENWLAYFDYGGPGNENETDWRNTYLYGNEYVQSADQYDPKIYAHFYTPGSEVYIQYWFFYPYNDWVNNHEGDWEHISVKLTSTNPATAQISRMHFFMHHEYIDIPNSIFLDKAHFVDETHPVVFVGGHGYWSCWGINGGGEESGGSYPSPGRFYDVGASVLDCNIPYEEVSFLPLGGKFLHYRDVDLEVLPDFPEPGTAGWTTFHDNWFIARPHMQWMTADTKWGFLRSISPGTGVPFTGDVGQLAPGTPFYSPAWNSVYGDAESYLGFVGNFFGSPIISYVAMVADDELIADQQFIYRNVNHPNPMYLNEADGVLEVPSTIQNGNDHYVFSSWEDGSTDPMRTVVANDTQSESYTALYLPEPVITLPAGGATRTANGLFRVQWHYPSEPPEGTILDHTIFVDYGDGSAPTTLASGLGNIRWHDVTMPTVYSSNATVIVKATWDGGTTTQDVTPAFTIAPNTAISQPKDGLHYVPQNPLTVQWVACPDGCSTMESYDISFSNDGGQTFSLEAHIADPMISIYALSFSDPQGNQCRVKIDYHYTDVATGLEQTLTSVTGDFTIDNEFLGYLWYEHRDLVPSKASTTILDHDGNGKLDLVINEGDFLSTYEFDEFSPFGVFVGGSDLLETCTDCPSLVSITDFAFADFDNDGDLDVYLGQNGPNYLIENNGDGTYSRYQSSIVEDGGWCSSVSWVDYDSNGELDILVCNLGQSNRMFRNAGGVFNEQPVGLFDGPYEKATWADYDGDGDLDVYMVGFDSAPNRLFRYDGAAGFSERNILEAHQGAYVLDAEWADFDNDGDMDLSLGVWGIDGVYLYENQGEVNGDIQFASSLVAIGGGVFPARSLAWTDIDNDGDLDCWVGGPNAYLENEGGGVFAPNISLPGQTDLRSAGQNLIAGDMDGDGAIDVFVDEDHGGVGVVDANFFQYINTTENSWLSIELTGLEYSNRDGIGAKLTVQNGAETITRFVNGDGGRFGKSFGPVHMGLGDLTSCNVKVEWPSGIVQSTQVNQLNRTIAIHENPGGGGGCPYVYVHDGESYVQENTILHEVSSARAKQAESNTLDEYLLATNPASFGGYYQIEIREFEQEHTYIDRVELYAVDHPTRSQIALLEDGRIVIHAGHLLPTRAETSEGTDITDLLLASDGEVFEGNPGDWVDIQYDIPEGGQLVATFQSQQKSAAAPPPKTLTGIEVLVLGDTPQESRSIGMVQPRELLSPQSLALADSYRGGKLVLRLQWHTKHELDDAAILTGVGSVLRRKQAPISSVAHSTRNYSRSVISENDADYAELLPGETLNLEFEAIPEKGSGDRSFLLAVDGHYVHLDQVPGEGAPRQVRLHPGSPQPFNPRTTLRIDLPRAMHVDMEIYSLSGRLVRKVLSREMTAGMHEVVWDGATSGGDQAAAGTYFVRLQTVDGIHTQKLLLVK